MPDLGKLVKFLHGKQPIFGVNLNLTISLLPDIKIGPSFTIVGYNPSERGIR